MLRNIENKIKQYSNLYGKSSLSVSHLTYLKLTILLNNNHTYLSDSIVETLKALYNIYFGYQEEVNTNYNIHTYKYHVKDIEIVKKSFDIHSSKILKKLSFTLDHSYLYNRFIFVFSPNDEFRYYQVPMNQELLLTENRNIFEYPTHVILSYDFGFSVKIAGEISFMWHENETSPSFIFINNISGHFIPKYWDTSNLNLYIRQQLHIPDEINIIALTNNGISWNGEKLS